VVAMVRVTNDRVFVKSTVGFTKVCRVSSYWSLSTARFCLEPDSLWQLVSQDGLHAWTWGHLEHQKSHKGVSNLGFGWTQWPSLHEATKTGTCLPSYFLASIRSHCLQGGYWVF
jgi:hypothetical protein